MSKFCTNCGTKLEEGVKFCTSCGKAVDGEVQNNNVQPVNNNNNNNVRVNNGAQNPKNGLAIAGFVVSLVSSLLCCGMFNMVGLVLSIVGLVKAKDYNGDGKGLAIAGIVICAVVMVLGIILYIILMAAGTATGDWTEVINEMENI